MRVHPVIPLHIIKALLGYILRAALSIDIYFPIFLHHFPSVTQNQRTIKKKRSPVDPKSSPFFTTRVIRLTNNNCGSAGLLNTAISPCLGSL